MKLLFTCGGTAGHINPAIALARLFQQKHPDTQVLFVGAEGGMETRLVPQEGFALKTVQISSFYRSLSPSALKHNAKTLLNLFRSRRQARRIIAEFQPDLVVGTGGYASFPVVREAARRGIPTAVHESNAVPGLTTRALSRVVDRVLVGFEESRRYYPHPERVVLTGTPVRGDFFALSREEARRQLGIDDDLPLVVTTWGSLGAQVMNQQMVEVLALEVAEGQPFHHIYGVGRRYYRAVTQALAEKGLEPAQLQRIDVREYIYDMAVVTAAADLTISRAGASTISEIIALARPAILVPSPNVTNNHQEKNARILADKGGAVLLTEGECSPELLFSTIQELLQQPQRRKEMSRALQQLQTGDACMEIYQSLLALLKS